MDATGTLWVFGGYGYDSAGTLGWLNDLWEYSSVTGMWTWVAGPDIADQKGIYGTQGMTAGANLPGARAAGNIWVDSKGNLWLLGGSGYDSTGTVGALNDVWEYVPSSGEWTWVAGSNTVNAQGVYGTQSVAAASSTPGGRDAVQSWVDASGAMLLFGGEGYNLTGTDPNTPAWNDLWKYPAQ